MNRGLVEHLRANPAEILHCFCFFQSVREKSQRDCPLHLCVLRLMSNTPPTAEFVEDLVVRYCLWPIIVEDLQTAGVFPDERILQMHEL